MSHLNERIVDYVFEELSATEMVEARGHLAQCSECREQVEQFQTTHAMLKTSADVEPPRRILFEFEKPPSASWLWRWLAPMAASAAVAGAIVSFAPRPGPQIIERVVQQPAPAQPTPASVQPVDYQKIIAELRASEQSWLANELNKREASQSREILRVRGDMAYLDALQRKVEKETLDNASSIQLLYARR